MLRSAVSRFTRTAGLFEERDAKNKLALRRKIRRLFRAMTRDKALECKNEFCTRGNNHHIERACLRAACESVAAAARRHFLTLAAKSAAPLPLPSPARAMHALHRRAVPMAADRVLSAADRGWTPQMPPALRDRPLPRRPPVPPSPAWTPREVRRRRIPTRGERAEKP